MYMHIYTHLLLFIVPFMIIVDCRHYLPLVNYYEHINFCKLRI